MSERIDKLQPSPTISLFNKAKQLEASGKDIVHFEVGEPDMATPQYIMDAAIDAMKKAFNLGTKYLTDRGITISIEDFDLDEKVISSGEEIIKKSEKKTNEIIEEYKKGSFEIIPGKTKEETREIKILQILNEIRTKIGEIVKKEFPKSNPVNHMILSGGGGNILNITQMACCVGQQALWGKRIEIGYEKRTLSFTSSEINRLKDDILGVETLGERLEVLKKFDIVSKETTLDDWYNGMLEKADRLENAVPFRQGQCRQSFPKRDPSQGEGPHYRMQTEELSEPVSTAPAACAYGPDRTLVALSLEYLFARSRRQECFGLLCRFEFFGDEGVKGGWFDTNPAARWQEGRHAVGSYLKDGGGSGEGELPRGLPLRFVGRGAGGHQEESSMPLDSGRTQLGPVQSDGWAPSPLL